MRKYISILVVLICFSGCRLFHRHQVAQAENKDFEQFKNEFIDKLWATYPGWATSQGYHKYDSVLVIPDAAERQKELDFAQWTENKLNTFEPASLSANERTDYELIKGQIASTRFNINELKSYQWDPSVYNVGELIFNVMDYKKMSLDERLLNISKKLALVPAYFEAARKNIKNPTKEHTGLAVKQNIGSLYFFSSVFPDSLKASHLSEAQWATFITNADSAKRAIESYAQWLLTEYLDKADTLQMRSFRIGKDLYAKKFKLDIDSRYEADEMYKKALVRKDYLHKDMKQLSDQLWTKYFPHQNPPEDTLLEINLMVTKLSLQHCDKDSFLQTIEKQLPELTAFINAHKIIDLDSTKPLKVRKTPEYAAGVAGAGINSPGPYDTDAVTYYNVTPLTKYSEEDAESYLREYNNYVLQILNIHEAIPGHYTQLIYANRSPSIIKSILGNGAMIEGWACYVERMMIEEGYSASPEMQLFYDKWNLREVCNFLLDYNIHCNNWTEDQVMDLLVHQAFQQNAEAKEKWKRATLSQVQLASYFTGQTEIYELRDEMKKQEGSDFDLKKFHEQFLSYGSAPVKEIKNLMTGE